jgi:sulfatase maturation enzyme AslB (radical SAM superfamily)
MKLISLKEAVYQYKYLQQVKHITLNPNGPGVIRIHMVPPRLSFNKDIPSIIILNGQDILPVNLSWAILLSVFIDEMFYYDNKEMSENDWETVVNNTIKNVKKVYPRTKEDILKDDLRRIIKALTDIATGKKPEEDIGIISIGDYAKNMKAPHRMDLMISSMTKNGCWNCNQNCLHCYAADQKLANTRELCVEAWKEIIQKCREAGIPQLTFTGGEPTLRKDLVELVEYSKWFITRLNTNGVCLSEELCRQLYEASLDSVQITLTSAIVRGSSASL